MRTVTPELLSQYYSHLWHYVSASMLEYIFFVIWHFCASISALLLQYYWKKKKVESTKTQQWLSVIHRPASQPLSPPSTRLRLAWTKSGGAIFRRLQVWACSASGSSMAKLPTQSFSLTHSSQCYTRIKIRSREPRESGWVKQRWSQTQPPQSLSPLPVLPRPRTSPVSLIFYHTNTPETHPLLFSPPLATAPCSESVSSLSPPSIVLLQLWKRI